jgi:hypothetical protein
MVYNKKNNLKTSKEYSCYLQRIDGADALTG